MTSRTNGSGPRPPVVVAGLLWAGLSLARSLGRDGVDVTGVSVHEHEFGLRSRYLRRAEAVPAGDQRRRDERVLELVAEAGAGGARPIFVPERDDHVELVLRNWEALHELADVPLPDDPEVVRRLRRKDVVAEHAERAGIPFPATVAPTSADDLRRLELRPPYLVKPVEGQHFASAFRRKVLVAETRDELVDAWRAARERGFDTVVQECVPHATEKVFSLFAYVGRDGSPLATVVGRKIRQGPVGFGTSAVFETLDEPRVREAGLRLLTDAGYRGFGHVEFAHDARDDAFKLLEVNTRMPMWAGVGMTRWFDVAPIAYDDMRGLPVGEPRHFSEELVWIFMGKDLWVSAQMAAKRDLGPLRFLGPYARSRKVRAVFAADDPLPALASIGYLTSKVA